MAQAIEDSDIILFCVTEKYSQSLNCQKEAEYAFVQQKIMIPLLLQSNYKPTGWLGLLMGTSLYIDFTKNDFTQNYSKLIHEIAANAMRITSNKNDVPRLTSNSTTNNEKTHRETDSPRPQLTTAKTELTLRKEIVKTSYYNESAGKSDIGNAGSYDRHGNPIGKGYDLGQDGSFTEYSILIGQLYLGGELSDAEMQKPIEALKVKGFQVKHVRGESVFLSELRSKRYQIAWVISTSSIADATFISALMEFHSGGGAIFLFADNTPYLSHASEFLNRKFGVTLTGDFHGGQTLAYKENGHLVAGHFGQHDIFTGIKHLYEGITICHPVHSNSASRTILMTVATATDGNPCISAFDPPANSKEGRLCLDCGFTKLFINWDDAGTARYIVNVSCWLTGIDRRHKF
ncbi:unnamed protein product [Rotaria sp. Silwood2]|nr:unnamed protein product [Rotaria sp. Silwood2]